MRKKLIINSLLLDIIVDRLCHQLIENHGEFRHSVILAIQPNGSPFAEMIKKKLTDLITTPPSIGYLDATFYRDDFRRKSHQIKANQTRVDFIVEDKRVILIDDVLYTGRTVRAALDAMIAFGRPLQVELLVLVDRKYTRDLPISANYIGKQVNTQTNQQVEVELKIRGGTKNCVWLINKKN